MAKWTSLFAIFLIALALLTLSPLGLHQIATNLNVNWALLSDVGEAYGPAVALLTVASLLVLALSVVVQARAVRIAAETTGRMLHLEIMRLVMEDPSLVRVEGVKWNSTKKEADKMRMWVYANLQLASWRSLFRMDGTTSAALRRQLQARFSTDIGREHWDYNRVWYEDERRDRLDRKFSQIVDEEYHKAIRLNETPVTTEISNRMPSHALLVGGVIAILAASAGVLAGRKWR